MSPADLPSLPSGDATGPQVCAIVHLHLAVLNDLSAEQVQAVYKHVATCADCAIEQRLFTQAQHLVSDLAAYAPPAHVDQVIQAAIATRSNTYSSQHIYHSSSPHHQEPSRPIGYRLAAALLAATLLMITAIHFISSPPGTSPSFMLPTTLSWSGYVLDYSETQVSANRARYNVHCYHDLGMGRMRVEITNGQDLHVVIVSDKNTLLGMDLVHHIVQWGANTWRMDDSLFDLTQLRSDLQAKLAVYEGRDHFAGQEVFRIRWKQGLVLLLDQHYQPLNVLRDTHGPGTGKPIYERLHLWPRSQLPDTLWDMSVPTGFQMGILPEKPL